MKWIAALLMIVNIAIYLSVGGRSVTLETETHSGKPDVNKEGMLLLIHGEVTDTDIDVFDREKVFIDRFFYRQKCLVRRMV